MRNIIAPVLLVIGLVTGGTVAYAADSHGHVTHKQARIAHLRADRNYWEDCAHLVAAGRYACLSGDN